VTLAIKVCHTTRSNGGIDCDWMKLVRDEQSVMSVHLIVRRRDNVPSHAGKVVEILMTSRRAFISSLALTGVGTAISLPLAEPRSRTSPRPWREAFPGLAERVNGQPLVYLDNAATTHRVRAVVDAEREYYWHANGNPANSLHTLARRAGELYQGARQTLATFLNAPGPDEVVWCRGATEAINLVAASWGRSTLGAGDEILLSVAEHYSNLLPWQSVARHTGAVLRFVNVAEDGRILLSELDRVLSSRTRLVSLAHVSNVFGVIQPIPEICARAHARRALVLVDGAQSAPHIPIDVQALGCDFFALSAHKMAGPTGIGALWARRELLDAMPPYQLGGGHMAQTVEFTSAQYSRGADKFEAGSPNVAGAVGWEAAIRFLTEIGRERIRAHQMLLVRHMLNRLAALRRVGIVGAVTPDQRLGIFSFTVQGMDPAVVARSLDQRGIAITAGSLSAAPVLRQRGHDAVARASLYLYNNVEEIDRLAEGLERLGA
jgi:cysteine desulfurase/selenocysteine lyase